MIVSLYRQSRILTPLATLNAEEQSMSSGDESDNEDLTDVETSDSDWSETGEPLNINNSIITKLSFQMGWKWMGNPVWHSIMVSQIIIIRGI